MAKKQFLPPVMVRQAHRPSYETTQKAAIAAGHADAKTSRSSVFRWAIIELARRLANEDHKEAKR